MKRVPMQIYRRTDYDLLSLALNDSFSFMKLCKEVLVSYANGDIYTIVVPEGLARNIPDDVLCKKIAIYLYEDNPRDNAAIHLLDTIKNRKRNDFLKNLLRGYLCGPIVTSYFANDAAIEEAVEKERRFNENCLSKRKVKRIIQNRMDVISFEAQKIPSFEEETIAHKEKEEINVEAPKPPKKPEGKKKKKINLDMTNSVSSDAIEMQSEEEDPMDIFESMMASFE